MRVESEPLIDRRKFVGLAFTAGLGSVLAPGLSKDHGQVHPAASENGSWRVEL
jgi:hypothetical protein